MHVDVDGGHLLAIVSVTQAFDCLALAQATNILTKLSVQSVLQSLLIVRVCELQNACNSVGEMMRLHFEWSRSYKLVLFSVVGCVVSWHKWTRWLDRDWLKWWHWLWPENGAICQPTWTRMSQSCHQSLRHQHNKHISIETVRSICVPPCSVDNNNTHFSADQRCKQTVPGPYSIICKCMPKYLKQNENATKAPY